MSRRSPPERLDAARRAATLARLIGDGELPGPAEAALVAWERQSADQRPRASWWVDGRIPLDLQGTRHGTALPNLSGPLLGSTNHGHTGSRPSRPRPVPSTKSQIVGTP
jgi:hypothetical protein